jgi:hypothetical protein
MPPAALGPVREELLAARLATADYYEMFPMKPRFIIPQLSEL